MKISTKHLVAMTLVLGGLSSCTNTHTYTVGDGKGQAVVTTDGTGSGTVKVQGGDGQNVTMNMGTNATYPSTLPFPQYPSSKVTLAINNDGAQESNTVSLESADRVDKVVAFYRSWFNSNGWKINAETSTQGMGSLTAQKDDRTSSIMAMPGSDGHITIQIILSKDKK